MSAVLVVRPSSLGDVVYALALVSDVRQHRPDWAIDWVAERAFVPLVEMDPRVRHVFALGLRNWRRRPLAPATWRDVARFAGSLKRERYAAVLNLQEQVKGALVGRMARGVRHGFDRATIRERAALVFDDVHHHVPRDLHFVERCRMLAARALGYCATGSPRWQLRPPPLADVALRARPYVVALHMTTRAEKLWPEAHWHALIAHLSRAGLRIVLPWGTPPEAERSARLAQGAEDAVVPLHMELPQIAALLQGAVAAVGVDTGLTHLAAALQTPTLALFTATPPGVAGVACTGSGVDLGGNGIVPGVDEAISAISTMIRGQPRC